MFYSSIPEFICLRSLSVYNSDFAPRANLNSASTECKLLYSVLAVFTKLTQTECCFDLIQTKQHTVSDSEVNLQIFTK